MSAPKLTTATSDFIALESGFYNMNIEYRGEDSYIRLTDALGRIRGFKFGVDLTGPSTTVDFDGGLSVSVSNSGWTENSSLQVPIEYNRRPPAIEEFDFRQYTEQIEKAMTAIDDELVKMQETADQIQELNAQRNPQHPSNGRERCQPERKLQPQHPVRRHQWPDPGQRQHQQKPRQAADQIFATTTAFATQANQTRSSWPPCKRPPQPTFSAKCARRSTLADPIDRCRHSAQMNNPTKPSPRRPIATPASDDF